MLTQYCECNSFQVTSELLNSTNLKVSIGLQFYYVKAEPKSRSIHT